MGESLEQFLNRQRRKAKRAALDITAAAQEARRTAMGVAQSVASRSPEELLRQGEQLLRHTQSRATEAATNVQREIKRQVTAVKSGIEQNPQLRSVATDATRTAGNVAGVVRGGLHAVQGLADGAIFLTRYANPLDPYLSPPGQSARNAVEQAGVSVARYMIDGATHPQKVVDDVTSFARQLRADVDPRATPTAPTFEGELQRQFDIGQNQGELMFDVGSLAIGGPLAKTVKGVSRVSNVGNVEHYLAMGLKPRQAARFAEPYLKGMGHHFFPRKLKLPEAFSESVFNVLRPAEISRGDFYKLHFQVDPSYHGGPIFRGEKGWSGKALGWKKYGPLGRLWHGSPAPLKARVGGLGATAGNLMYSPEDEGIDP